MKEKQIKLTLENSETIICSMAGQGERIGFIVGPGSFYFTGLSSLQNNYTFVTCDAIWTYGKSSSLRKLEDITAITRESIKERDHLIIKALKKYFGVEHIDGFGFSAPGAFLFEEALEHPEDFEQLIGTGIGLTELDSTFAKTNAIFYSHAAKERQAAFDEHQNQYKKFQLLAGNNTSTEQDIIAFFDVKPSSKIPLKPHKQFVAETIAMAPKLLFNFSEPAKSKELIIEHWKHNPFRGHVDKRMQEHFFKNIYPGLKPLSTLLELEKIDKKILLIYGDNDFITPLPKEIEKELCQTRNLKLEIIADCSHMAYMESGQKYSEIVIDFVMSGQAPTLTQCKL